MLDGIKRWLGGGVAASAAPWDGVVPWAESHEYRYREVPERGFVIDGRLGATAWRLEWGPAQRPYIGGHELRIRSEMGLSPDLQAVLLNRQLQEQLERLVYEQSVEGTRTRIDNQTPPEMRWIVMFPRVDEADMAGLAQRWVAQGSQRGWLQQWLEGPLASSLHALRVEPGVPVVLMIGRGRLMLRTALEEPDVPMLQMWLRLFESAMREARRVANEHAVAPSTGLHSTVWGQSALPGDERRRG
jgi:hypothetical protein